MATCSLASASTVTRPCCISTRLKCLRGSNVSRVKSPCIVLRPRFASPSSVSVHNAYVHPGRCELFQTHAKIRFALRLKEIVEDSYLGFVIRAPLDFIRTCKRQLRKARFTIADTRKLRPDADLLAGDRRRLQSFIGNLVLHRLHHQIRLARVTAWCAAAAGDIAEAHAA